MATIVKIKRKKGLRWKALVRRRGYPTETKTFGNMRDARRWAKGVEADIDRGVFVSEDRARKTLLSDLIGEYDKHCGVGAKTLAKLNWWCEKLGDPTLDRLLDRTLIVRALDDLMAGDSPSGRKVKRATRNRYLAAIRSCLSFGIDRGYVPKNAARGIAQGKEASRLRRLTDGERKALLEACDESRDRRLYPLVLLALASGGRQGELLGLNWSDVDSKRGRVLFTDTKNDDSRGIGVSQSVLRELHERLVRHVSGLVFADADGEPRFPRTAWERALDEAEIDDFRFHDLRHDFASRLAEGGASLAELSEALGHRTLAMVKRYSHLAEGHVADVTRRASESLL